MASRSKIIKDLIEKLQYFQRESIEQPKYYVRQLLGSIYEAGTNNISFTFDEKKSIGPLFLQALKHVDDFLFDIGNSFDNDRAPEYLYMRSGLQFLYDKYSDMPVTQRESLKNALKNAIDEENIIDVDDALQEWKEKWSPGNENFTIDVSHLRRPTEVPASHTWWY